MMMPGRKYTAGSEYRYSFNGQEKTNDVASNSTTAEFWQYDSRISRRWNVDPKPISGISPYSVFAGNPIVFLDSKGDSIDLGNLYERDKDGLYKNLNDVFAFELFAKTEKGREYILQHAQKGFKLTGVFVSGLYIEAKVEGSESKKGIDISIGIVDKGYVKKQLGINGYAMTDDYNIKNGRLKLSFKIERNDEISSISDPLQSRDAMLNHMDDFTHEFFLHGDLQEKKFINNSSVKWDSHHKDSYLASKYGGEKKGLYTNSAGLIVLQQAQTLKMVLNQGLKPHSKEYLFQKIMATGLGLQTLDFISAGQDIPSY